MLSVEEVQIADRLSQFHTSKWGTDERLLKYHDGRKTLSQIGISIPPDLDVLEVVVNWPRVAVEAIVERSDVRTIRRFGELNADSDLMGIYMANNLDSQIPMFNRDKLIYGRAFMSVGANEHDPDLPLIMVESPREISVDVDRRRRAIKSALRLIRDDDNQIASATLYRPDSTVWLEFRNGKWQEIDRDEHGLGRVPIVMCLNRQRTGDWEGRSEMADVIPFADAAARTLTNMQFAIEAAAVPRKYAIGVSPTDFVGAGGEPLTQWESYIGSVWALANKEAKVGQLPGADLTGFISVVEHYGKLASSVTGYPASYFGHSTANPASFEGIKAEEGRLVKTVVRSNGESGKALAWALELAERFRGGEWTGGNPTEVDWHDPGTPTYAQRADALQKYAGGVPIISREGAWDEMGWTEARMERERERFEKQDADPAIQALMDKAESLG